MRMLKSSLPGYFIPRLWLCLCFSFFSITFAQGDDNADIAVPEKEVYTVGAAEFRYDGPEAGAYAATSLPLLIVDGLRGLESHYLNDEERVATASFYRKVLLEQSFLELDEALSARDKVLFIEEPEARDNAEKSAETNINKIRERIDKIPDLVIHIPELLTLEFIENADGLPFVESSRVVVQPARAFPEADMVLEGAIEGVEDYLLVSFKLRSPYFSDFLIEDTLAMKYEKLSDGAREVIKILAPYIAGTPVGSLRVTGVAENAPVFLGDRLLGLGPGKYSYIPEGEQEVRVHLGNSVISENLTIEAGKITEFLPVLEETVRRSINITSVPSGVNVYSGALWIGTTPLQHYVENEFVPLVLEAEGFMSEQLYLPTIPGEDIHVEMRPQLFDVHQRIEDARDRFYNAFGFFLLSIPVPIILYGLQENAVRGYNQTVLAGASVSQQQQFLDAAQYLYVAYYAGLFLVGSLGINMGLTLADYISATDYLE